MENEKSPILEIKDLRVTYETDIEVVEAVNGISFQIEKGKTLGLVGETGAGKTTTALSILRLLPETTGRIKGGEICFEGEDLLHVDEEQMRGVRGNRISMVFQDPMSSLNPVYTVGDQIGEAIRLHRPELSNDAVEQRIDEILQLVGIMPSRKHEYPHQFSGGTVQANTLKQLIAASPYPTIICGDFNSLPSSYVYHTVKGDKLQDGFQTSGHGYMYTFKFFKHLLRIDYILHSPELNSTDYFSPDLTYSDHNPVVMRVKL